MKRFDVIRTLGDGGFGIVYECRDKETGEHVAIKKVKQRFATFDECLQLKEVKSLRKIKHVNVVKLLQIFREHDCLFLVFELMGDTLLMTIDKYSRQSQKFTDAEVRKIMGEILTGLSHVHKQGFFHRDMKPDNIMWSEGGVIKISDFGLAREIRSRPPYTEYVSTRWYRAPEIAMRSPYYNSPVDIWAAGAIMAELYLGRAIFPGASETDQIFKIISVLGTPNLQQWPEGAKLAQKINLRFPSSAGVALEQAIPGAPPAAINLIQEMFRWDPAKRPSASQALNHPFFTAENNGSSTDVGKMDGHKNATTWGAPKPVMEQQERNSPFMNTAPVRGNESTMDGGMSSEIDDILNGLC